MMQTGKESESEIIELAQSGNSEAFETLVRNCGEIIYNLSLKLTGNFADAEDLAQETFVNAYKNISKFEHKCSFSTWVYKVTINLWKNKIKYDERHFSSKHVSIDKPIDTDEGEIKRDLPELVDVPEKNLEKKQSHELIQKLLNSLDEEAKLMIILRDIENRNYNEIAELLDCPLGTVKSRINRAREVLRQKYMERKKNGL